MRFIRQLRSCIIFFLAFVMRSCIFCHITSVGIPRPAYIDSQRNIIIYSVNSYSCIPHSLPLEDFNDPYQ
jgi:hypothetical protein